MTNAATSAMAGQLGVLFAAGTAAGLSDGQLLDRFATDRDEAAFAAIVARHGSMVLGVCRQLLGDHQHAEDAFQAVFLVLARKARSIRDPELLGNWLYGVALRTSQKARTQLARRRRVEERGAADRPEARPAVQVEQAIGREQAEALHREIDRLPGDFRTAVVLCDLEGLSPDEAAARLRWPSGTLRSRLARGRDKLRRGLARHGFALSSSSIAPRSVPSLLCATTTRAAIHFVAPHNADGTLAAAIAREVLQTMMIQTLRSYATAMAILAVGAGAFATGRPSVPGVSGSGDPATTPGAIVTTPGVPNAALLWRGLPTSTLPGPQVSRSSEGRMTVIGRVIGLDGRPASGVPVDVIAATRTPPSATDAEREPFVVLGQGSADPEGRFAIESTRASSSRYRDVYALAGADGPGTAFGCVSLPTDSDRPEAEIRLQPERVIRGRLVDIQGQPAAGVEVQVRRVYSDRDRLDGGRFDSPIAGRGYLWYGAPPGLRAWPRAVTDPQGRFVLSGVGRGLDAWASVRDPRYAQQQFVLRADEKGELSSALQPATIIEGRALAADTGRPIPGAVIAVRSSTGQFGAMMTTKFRGDEKGHFRINPLAGDYFRLRAFAPEGEPYLGVEAELAWTKGAVKMEKDLTLARGVLLVGKVIEQPGGRPVAGAAIQFFPSDRSGDVVSGFEAATAGREDGTFQLAVPPGKGCLMILGPTLDFIPKEITGGELYAGRPRRGGWRFYAHEIVAYDARPGDGPQEVKATLRRGETVTGRVIGPAGETVEDAVILARRQPIDPLNLTWQEHDFPHARGGRFELHGLDPEKATTVYFLDAEHGWGAVVELSGKPAEEPVIRLKPCGTARMRFVGPDGRPLARLMAWPYLHLIMTPGTIRDARADRDVEPVADQAYLPNVDTRHYREPAGMVTDADGRLTLPALIPGAPYRITDWSTVNDQKRGLQLRKDFSVEPGQTIDLGDALVENPR